MFHVLEFEIGILVFNVYLKLILQNVQINHKNNQCAIILFSFKQWYWYCYALSFFHSIIHVLVKFENIIVLQEMQHFYRNKIAISNSSKPDTTNKRNI